MLKRPTCEAGSVGDSAVSNTHYKLTFLLNYAISKNRAPAMSMTRQLDRVLGVYQVVRL